MDLLMSIDASDDEEYNEYVRARGLRYLKVSDEQALEQFITVFQSTFAPPPDDPDHGRLWVLDANVAKWLFDAVLEDRLTGLQVCVPPDGQELAREPGGPLPRYNPAEVFLLTQELDEVDTINRICKFILDELAAAYSQDQFTGYRPGKQLPLMIGRIDLLGLINLGHYRLLCAEHREVLYESVAEPTISNLIIINACDCPNHFDPPSPSERTAPVFTNTRKRMERHDPSGHSSESSRSDCYTCSPTSPQFLAPDKVPKGPADTSVEALYAPLEAAIPPSVSAGISEVLMDRAVKRSRQRIISQDAELGRRGRQWLRPTATAATEAAKEEALRLTTESLRQAGFPGLGDVSSLLRELNRVKESSRPEGLKKEKVEEKAAETGEKGAQHEGKGNGKAREEI